MGQQTRVLPKLNFRFRISQEFLNDETNEKITSVLAICLYLLLLRYFILENWRLCLFRLWAWVHLRTSAVSVCTPAEQQQKVHRPFRAGQSTRPWHWTAAGKSLQETNHYFFYFLHTNTGLLSHIERWVLGFKLKYGQEASVPFSSSSLDKTYVRAAHVFVIRKTSCLFSISSVLVSLLFGLYHKKNH